MRKWLKVKISVQETVNLLINAQSNFPNINIFMCETKKFSLSLASDFEIGKTINAKLNWKTRNLRMFVTSLSLPHISLVSFYVKS